MSSNWPQLQKKLVTYLKSFMESIWSLTARTKSAWPPMVVVTIEKLCHEYLLRTLSIADAWCSTEGANWSILESDIRCHVTRKEDRKDNNLLSIFTRNAPKFLKPASIAKVRPNILRIILQGNLFIHSRLIDWEREEMFQNNIHVRNFKARFKFDGREET
jgi:hypothetical protein